MKLISAKFFGWYYIATRQLLVFYSVLNSEARKYAAYTEKTLAATDSGDKRKLSYDSRVIQSRVYSQIIDYNYTLT